MLYVFPKAVMVGITGLTGFWSYFGYIFLIYPDQPVTKTGFFTMSYRTRLDLPHCFNKTFNTDWLFENLLAVQKKSANFNESAIPLFNLNSLETWKLFSILKRLLWRWLFFTSVEDFQAALSACLTARVFRSVSHALSSTFNPRFAYWQTRTEKPMGQLSPLKWQQ